MVHTWTISITKKVNKQFQIESILGAKNAIFRYERPNDLPYKTIKIKPYLLQPSPSPTSWKFSVVANLRFRSRYVVPEINYSLELGFEKRNLNRKWGLV